MVFVDTPGDAVSGAAALRLAIGIEVLTGEGDGGRIVMQLGQIQIELLHGMGDDLGHERGAVGEKKRIQATADPIIIERACGGLGKSQQGALVALGPLGKAIQRATRDEDVAQKYRKTGGRVEFLTSIADRDELLKERLDLQALEEAVDEGQRADDSGDELEYLWVRLGHRDPLAQT